MKKSRIFVAISLLVLIMCIIAPDGAMANPDLDWPGLYDPFTMLTFNLVMAPGDWGKIVKDRTYEIEVPALFWATEDGNDPPILVSVRRKSATTLGKDKISLKIDINEYTVEDDFGDDVCDGNYGFTDPTCVEKWHGVKKMSLENGDDSNVISEGLAWYLHRVAAESGLDYTPGYASWVTVTVNSESKGVYVNVEQRDKQWLKNHGFWEGSDDTWLYKYSDVNSPEIKEAPEDDAGVPIDSPLQIALCYAPFDFTCDEPEDFKEQLINNINMESLLTLGAVAAFEGSPDDLLRKTKNFYLVDYSSAEIGLREYTEWDLDSAFTGNKTNESIYNHGKKKDTDTYEAHLIASPESPFRNEYNKIMQDLLDGPFDEANLFPGFDAIEAAISVAVDADPNNQLGSDSAGEEFAKLRDFVTARKINVQEQLPPQ